MHKVLIIILTVTLVLFFSCSNKPNEIDQIQTQTGFSLKNQYSEKIIKSVSLVGYEFNNLNIAYSESQTFILDKGMSAGYNNINVVVSYGSGLATWFINKKFNFIEGDIIEITLMGSNAEGDPNYNNPHLE